MDGASRGNPGPAGAGAVLRDGTDAAKEFSWYLGETTNNVAEYLALIYALQEALKHRYTHVAVKTDSELLVRQLQGAYKVREPHLRLLYDLATHLIGAFAQCELAHVPRERNAAADRLAGLAATSRQTHRSSHSVL